MELKKLLCCILLTVGCTLPGYAQDQPWARYADVEAGIEQPSFPERNFLITDFGARPDDSLALCHEAIDRAILACSLAGGGHVVVPQGTFYTGPITLKSNVDLHLEKGACLKFSTDKALYTPTVLTRWEGVDCYNLRPLIYARGETNLAITGQGTIDGQADNDSWWHMCGNAERFGWRKGMISAARGGRERLLGFGETQTPVALRQMTLEDGLRPQLINLCHCTRVLIESVSLRNSPFWVIHPLFCEDLTVRGVDIFSHGPNSDGCDPESCNDVLIEDCRFDTGDDCIAIKSGRNMDGRRWDTPSSNIIVRRCEMKDGHGGVVIGSEISGGCRNVYVEDCRMDSPNLDRVIRIKTNNCRGGVVDGVYVRRVDVGQCREAVLKINLLYESREDCDRSYPPYVRNVMLDHVTSGKSQYGVLITGYEDRMNIENVSVTNSSFDGVEREPLSIRGAKGLHFDNFRINGKAVDN